MKEYILEVKKLIPPILCEKIINYFGKDDFKESSTTGYGVNKDVRICLLRNLFEIRSFGQEVCAAAVRQKVIDGVKHYQLQHHVGVDRISELNLLKYETNHHKAGFVFHDDFGPTCSDRHLSISICLNNDFAGGEFVFNMPGPHGPHKSLEHYTVPQNEGDAIIFPSNFMFPHQVNKVTEGTRYALIAWVI